MEDNMICARCMQRTCTNIDVCRACADYKNKQYEEANDFAEKTAFINLILVWTCLALIVAGIVEFII